MEIWQKKRYFKKGKEEILTNFKIGLIDRKKKTRDKNSKSNILQEEIPNKGFSAKFSNKTKQILPLPRFNGHLGTNEIRQEKAFRGTRIRMKEVRLFAYDRVTKIEKKQRGNLVN